MHAFDYNYISGKKIIVRTAGTGEKITTLDGVARELEENMLVIADETKPVALAGIMGGENSGILDATNTIVFESANFEKMSVRHTSRKLGLRTDSSANFEKGLDPHLTILALDRACELVEELNRGTVVAGVIDEYRRLPENIQIKLNADKINSLLGSSISREEMINILEKLGFESAGDGNFIVPSYRSDISDGETAADADLAEEISRIYGYNNIRREHKADSLSGGRDKFQKFLQNIHSALISSGYYETYTFSFITPKYFDMLNLPEDSPLRDYITLINPLGEDTSAMRTALLPSTLAILAKNYANRNDVCYFYDMAKTYFPAEQVSGEIKGAFAAVEKNVLSFGFYNTEDKSADFYTLKSAAENIMHAAGINDYKISSDINNHPLACAYHPGRSAVILTGESVIGILGEVHPTVAGNFEVGAKCYAAEIDIDLLYENSNDKKVYAPLPKYPAMTRDIALVCEENTESETIYDIIKKQSGKIFEWARPFDVYRGEKIGAGKKGVAFAMSFRDKNKTLGDGEVNAVMEKILSALEKIGITLRK